MDFFFFSLLFSRPVLGDLQGMGLNYSFTPLKLDEPWKQIVQAVLLYWPVFCSVVRHASAPHDPAPWRTIEYPASWYPTASPGVRRYQQHPQCSAQHHETQGGRGGAGRRLGRPVQGDHPGQASDQEQDGRRDPLHAYSSQGQERSTRSEGSTESYRWDWSLHNHLVKTDAQLDLYFSLRGSQSYECCGKYCVCPSLKEWNKMKASKHL